MNNNKAQSQETFAQYSAIIKHFAKQGFYGGSFNVIFYGLITIPK